MFVKDNLEEIKTTITNHFPNPGLPLLFIGVAVALLIVAGHESHLFEQLGGIWSVLAIALLLFIGLSGSLPLLRRAPKQVRNSSVNTKRN